ncbi:hypothetical protein ACWF82_15165 [Nocardia sp. NPDC055053]
MFDTTYTAIKISSWNDLGVKLPKELAKSIGVFDAIRSVTINDTPKLDIESITPENAESVIRQYADTLAVSLPMSSRPGQAGLSALESSKVVALETAARNVLWHGDDAVPGIIEQLTPEFEKRVAAYTEAVQKLPEEITMESIASAGPDTLAVWQEARTQARELDWINNWLSSLLALPSFRKHNEFLRYLRLAVPANRTEFHALKEAAEAASRTDSYRAEINPIYLATVRNGIEWGINTPESADAIVSDIQAQPIPENAWSANRF